ncbi:MAG: phosphate acyltransferase PlsX [Thermoanaerobaculales bacterium]|nr:phosphate acyltransferase PlsX [Thermoanaerobaculales bacterium]
MTNSIAIDAMGGDGAPSVVVEGALAAVEELGLRVILVGPAKILRKELGRFRPLPDRVEIVDASDVVGMDDSPVSVLRTKRDSSLLVCARLVRDARASAMVTAGNTGAAWVAAKSTLGMIQGVERPALAVVLPKLGKQTLLLDVGANVECKPEHLVQFAVMGSFYSESVLGVSDPTVGLMSIGEEESKGGPRIRERYRVLSSAGINFVGTVEGRDVFAGDVDVIVTDGFTGNVILKVAEGLGEMVIAVLMGEARRSPVYGAGLLMAKGAFRNLKRKVDYSEYGGAPLLGINGACLVAHGRSTPVAIRNAVRFAADYSASGVVGRIGDKIQEVLEIGVVKGENRNE